MANLTHAYPRTYHGLPESIEDYGVANESFIYEGSALSNQTDSAAEAGYVATLVAGEDFVGFAFETVDNSAGLPGAKTVNTVTEGVIVLPVVGATIASIGGEVYASDGNTFTLTSVGNSPVGKVVKFLNNGTDCLVKFQGIGYRSI